MRKNIAFPFLTLSGESVIAPLWEYSLDGSEPHEAHDQSPVPGWDSRSSLCLRRTIKVDMQKAAEDLACAIEGSSLAAAVRVGTGGSMTPPRRIAHRELHCLAPDSTQASFDLVLPGVTLSTTVYITTAIVVKRPISGIMKLTPANVGDTVWSDTLRLRLDSVTSMFPIEVADLGDWFGDECKGALWELYWQPGSWTSDEIGALQLIVNSRFPEFVDRVKSLDPLTYKAIAGDVISQVCERFLKDANSEDEEYESLTIGARAQHWLDGMWPGMDYAGKRQILEQNPGRFRAAAAGLFDIKESGK